MKYLAFFLTLCATTFYATQYAAPPVAPGSVTPPNHITPEAGPRVDHGIDAFITGDFIYWTARIDNLSYVMTGVGNNITSVGKGSTKYPDWSWNPGFKAGIGLNLPHDSWDVCAEYTWYYSSASNASNAGGNGMLPAWNIANSNTLIQNNDSIVQARGEWGIHFYAIDVSLGRNYFISRFLTLRPFVGFKGSWIDQNYSVLYNIETTAIDTSLKMENNQDYWGVGLRSGLKTAWHIDPSWSLYGDFALATLWSQFEITRKDIRTDGRNPGVGSPPLDTPITSIHVEDNFHTIKSVLECGVGLRGEWWFFESRYHFMVQAGWEEQLWINHNNFEKVHVVQADHGDLILQGFTIKLRFDF